MERGVNNPGPPEGCKVSDHLKEANIDYSLRSKDGEENITGTSEVCHHTTEFRENFLPAKNVLHIQVCSEVALEWFGPRFAV